MWFRRVTTMSLVTVGMATVILLPWLGLRSTEPVESMRSARWFGLVVRAGWLSIALLGISALLTDVSQITSS